MKVNNIPRHTSLTSVPRLKNLTEVVAIPRILDINGVCSAIIKHNHNSTDIAKASRRKLSKSPKSLFG